MNVVSIRPNAVCGHRSKNKAKKKNESGEQRKKKRRVCPCEKGKRRSKESKAKGTPSLRGAEDKQTNINSGGER
jgi:hypothetical protein